MPGTVCNYTFQLASENMNALTYIKLQGTFYILHFVDGKSKDKLKKFILGRTKKKLGHQNLFSVLMIKVYSMC